MTTGASSSTQHGAHFRRAVGGAAPGQNLKAAQNILEGQVQRGVCRRHVVETQGARAIAGLLISGFAVPVPAAPLVLPISLQLGTRPIFRFVAVFVARDAEMTRHLSNWAALLRA
jgi:hypothetical protein